ncbi:hypothetical protein ACQPYA_03810 [Micromonospora sp. CA-263727]
MTSLLALFWVRAGVIGHVRSFRAEACLVADSMAGESSWLAEGLGSQSV